MDSTKRRLKILGCGVIPESFFFLYTYIFYFILFIYLRIYLFWLRWVFAAAHGLFSSCGEWGLLFVEVHRLLIVVASLVAEHGF